jgi:hypothetical protein
MLHAPPAGEQWTWSAAAAHSAHLPLPAEWWQPRQRQPCRSRPSVPCTPQRWPCSEHAQFPSHLGACH